MANFWIELGRIKITDLPKLYASQSLDADLITQDFKKTSNYSRPGEYDKVGLMKKNRRMSMGNSSPAFKGVGNTLQIILISSLSYKKLILSRFTFSWCVSD
jgi:hypothetical protein